MQQKRTKKLVPLKQVITENSLKFPLNFPDLIEQTKAKEETAEGICSEYKTKNSCLFLHHFPISKPPIF